jgi:hypothetical protein
LAEHRYLREHLLAEYREAIDEETLRDTLEGISSLPEALAAVVRSYLDELMVAAALGMRIGDMQQRLSRIEARVEKKRMTITQVMEKADIKKSWSSRTSRQACGRCRRGWWSGMRVSFLRTTGSRSLPSSISADCWER